MTENDRIDMPYLLYHWSPTSNRRSIERLGLVPGRPGIRYGWRAPFVCLSPDPAGALHMAVTSAGVNAPASWDLWTVDLDAGAQEDVNVESFFNDATDELKEIRVYGRIWKRGVHWLATRAHGGLEK